MSLLNKSPEKREKERVEADRAHELLEQLAKNAESKALAEKDCVMAKAIIEHQKDVAGFRFKCSRWGDWLEISAARLSNSPNYQPQTLSTAVSLNKVSLMTLCKRHAPDTEGVVSYHYEKVSNKGTGGWTSGYGNELPTSEWHYEVSPRFPVIPEFRPLIHRADMPSRCYVGLYDYNYYTIEHTTLNFAQPAEDDVIQFTGADFALSVPATLGEGVYKRLLAAKDTLPRRGKRG